MREPSDAPPGTTTSAGISREELQLAARNHGLPLEALRYEVTPVGLHYLLIHYDIPAVAPETWRLRVGGRVERPLELGLEEIQARPKVRRPVTLECAGNGRARLSPRALSQPWLLEAVGTGTWGGTPLAGLLEEAGVATDAVEVVFTGLDRGVEGGEEQSYARSLPLAEARREDALLAWELNGQPLPPQHGFPLRLVVPGWYGMTSVKWLASIEAVSEPFRGYQQERAYRFRQAPDEPGEPLTRIEPRALMLPPGRPDFYTRRRFLETGPCRLEGRAWSGWGAIEAVEVSVDDGGSWEPAEVAPAPAPYAWQRWSYRWAEAKPGEHTLCCRARDTTGRQQPAEPRWNLGGYAVNSPQRVAVTVVPSS